ncbi:zinc finger protein 550-like [Cheilinus undulatus]|uniref:zinc finger protein 550-like n=1 Tax=Cheilinus undulatus TaxID=241271 RepID=UPI001BD4B067|nr:zinc finger protein 550-like [Cheilinus undulatus]
MSKVQMLRSLVNQRLTAAAEEIFELFERTIAEYEEELGRSKENQRKGVEAAINPGEELHRADVQQLMMTKEEALPDQWKWSHSPDHKEPPETVHIKEEWDGVWTQKRGQLLQEAEEANLKMSTFSPVPMKTEADDEEPQSSQHHQGRSPLKETDADGQDFGGSGVDRDFNPEDHLQYAIYDETLQSFESETDDSNCDWDETWEPRSCFNTLRNKNRSDVKCNTGNTSVCSFESSTSTRTEEQLTNGFLVGEKPFSCSVCGKRYPRQRNLKQHMLRHSREKPFSCSVCNKSFIWKKEMMTHMRFHTGEKPFSCSICGKRFALHVHLRQHSTVHTKEKPFSCRVCDKRFTRLSYIKKHKCVRKSSKN